MSDAKLRITWKPIGHSTRVAITLEYGDVLFSDTLDVASQRQRERIVDEIVERFDGVNREEVARELERTAKARLTEEPTESKCKPDREPTREKLLAEHDTKVEELLEATDGEILAEAEALLRDPRLMDRVSNAIEALGVVGERKLGQTTYLLATSRLLDKPLSGLVQGASSSGKSFTITKVAELIPPESVFGITNHSPKSFYYMPNGSLMHRFIHAGEMPRGKDGDAIEARKALREMQSAGELSQAVPEKDASNRIVTRVVHQFGPIAYVESTTRADVFNEDLNRVIPLATDESPEQSRRVNLERGRRKARAGGRADLDHLLTVHRTAQRMLYRVSVVIPFARQLAELVPSERPESRRAFEQILAMIEAVAVLHQYQQPVEPRHGAEIEATIEHYRVARDLLLGPMGRSLGRGLAPGILAFAIRLWARFGGQSFKTPEATKNEQIVRTTDHARNYLNAMAQAGGIVEADRSSRPTTWTLLGEPAEEPGAVWLPVASAITFGSAEDRVSDADPSSGRSVVRSVQSAHDTGDVAEMPRSVRHRSFDSTDADRTDRTGPNGTEGFGQDAQGEGDESHPKGRSSQYAPDYSKAANL